MDRGTDARNFLLGNVIPLKFGYVGVVNLSQEDINFNRSVQDALAFEEKFFSTLPTYHGLAHCCGVPQLAKRLNMILLKHITNMLPGLKTRINAQLVAAAKEHAAYGGTVESAAGQGVQLLNILRKYCEAFSSMVEGKNRVSTHKLSGGARIHYIFQSIFVKSLETVSSFLTNRSIILSQRTALALALLYAKLGISQTWEPTPLQPCTSSEASPPAMTLCRIIRRGEEATDSFFLYLFAFHCSTGRTLQCRNVADRPVKPPVYRLRLISLNVKTL
jgi:hypothetical protein